MRRWRCSWRVTAPEPADIRPEGLGLPSLKTELMGLRPAARMSKNRSAKSGAAFLSALTLRRRFCPGTIAPGQLCL